MVVVVVAVVVTVVVVGVDLDVVVAVVFVDVAVVVVGAFCWCLNSFLSLPQINAETLKNLPKKLAVVPPFKFAQCPGSRVQPCPEAGCGC